ncbi:MAG: methionyl-tRNA formyltransferase [candidate division Zixibacteria bacterium]|nr:methionyl-tRNA formyltransferase [candidate division Zixibacteria bacterium]
MRIVFMGNPAFALPSLKRLYEDKHEILAAVTNPDKPAGRKRRLKSPEVKELAVQLGLDVIQPHSLKNETFIENLRNLNPELFVVVAFRILPKQMLDIPSKGSINLHASLLPAYRGAAPINWAIINGETETGISTFLIKPRVDTGDILLQRKTQIAPDAIYGEVYDELATVGAGLLSESVRLIESGEYVPLKQDEARATKAPKITSDLYEINFDNSTKDVINLIRGLSPKPGAYTVYRGKKVKILRAVIASGGAKSLPGSISVDSAGGKLQISCTDGVINILSIQPEGKKRMTGVEFINGYHPKSGESMGDEAA